MTDLEALVVAAYVFADESRVPARSGRPPLTNDAELVGLAVAQAATGISSDRQFLVLIAWGANTRSGEERELLRRL
jgi:hypothetical protein